MPARLIQIDPRGRQISFRLTREPVLIGRDPDADIGLAQYTRISRRHALVCALGRNHRVEDLGSRNGTRVNGLPVAAPVLLRNGDQIELGGEVTFVYEQTRGADRALLVSFSLLCALAALGGAAWWYLQPPPPESAASLSIPPESMRKASEGLAAHRAGDAERAKSQLRSAAGDLYRLGLLDHVDRGDVMKVAMQELGARLPKRPDLWSIFQETLEATRPRPPQPPPRPVDDPEPPQQPVACRLDRVPASEIGACIEEHIVLVLVELRQDPSDVPPDFYQMVARRMRREHGVLRRAFQRGAVLVPMLRSELEKKKMPPLLHYLALIESGYKAGARSPAKAAGLWQFIPGTAKRYGLVVSKTRDDRLDVDKSTRAAAAYLHDLAMEFGGDALLLALAGYNKGGPGMRRALKKLDDPFADRSYWKLVEKGLLPKETSDYVPRFITAAVAGEGGLPSRERLVEAGY